MKAARPIAVGVLVLVVAIVAWLLLRNGSHRYEFVFQNAGQLVRGNEVRVAGRPIGKVTDISLTPDNRALITVSVNEPYAPLTKGTTATIRAGSLSGQANKYIALSLGPNNAQAYPDGYRFDTDKTTTIVDLDQLFATLDPKTRKGLQEIIRGSSTQYGDKGMKANAALKQFNPLVTAFTELASDLNRDQGLLAETLVSSAKVTTLLAEKRDALAGITSKGAAAMSAIAAENASLDQFLAELPGTLRQGNTTLAETRAALDDLDRLTKATKPVAPKLAPFFRQLRLLATDSQPTIRDLRLILDRPGPNNDLTDLMRAQPRITSVSIPALQSTTRTLRKSTPVLTFARPYAPDLIGWFRDFGQSTANYDANGHFARVSPVTDAFSFKSTGPGTGTLTANSPLERNLMLQSGKFLRCPGTAATPPADGSAPFAPAGSDCDKSQVVPGP